MLACTDIVICATSAPHTIIKKEDIPKDRQLLIFDLAFPCDVEIAVRNFPNVRLYNLEDIGKTLKYTINQRRKEIIHAEKIIDEEMEKYFEWHAKYERIKNENYNYATY